jgi:hypothetical protein
MAPRLLFFGSREVAQFTNFLKEAVKCNIQAFHGLEKK